MRSMTLAEFKEQATRLHRRFPWVYPSRVQVDLAFHVQGLSIEWFKDRVDYLLKSGQGQYDWEGRANEERRNPLRRISQVTEVFVPVEENPEELQRILDQQGVGSLVELVTKKAIANE